MAVCRSLSVYILFLFFTVSSLAQVSKGDQYFQNLEYKKAISCYLTAFKKKKNSSNPELLAKMGDAFRFIKDYSNAANYYKLSVQNGSVNPDVNLHYAMILKTQGNYEEAEVQFKKCLEQRSGDVLALNGIRSCNDIKKWKSKPKEYETTNLEKINTEKSEFCPVVWKNKLVFVAERENDLINFTHYDFNGQPFLDVYSADLKGSDTGKPHGFSKKLNTEYHDGPVCFSKDGNEIYYTRVKYVVEKKNKDFVNRAKIYSSVLDGSKLKKETAMAFDSDEYNIAHPSLSDNGLVLFFSSDKPGGYGGMDIYCSTKTGDAWGPPVNLGPDINTSGNEEFPFIRSDGILFFSSDGLPGFGGLDVFSAYSVLGKWILQRNEGLGLNDITDDFGVFFINNKEGYFSSDRPGGKGADDIYRFTFTSRSQNVEGYILNSEDTSDVAKNQKVILVDSLGNRLGESRTDEKGYFKFENLEGEKNYLVKLDETDPDFTDYPRYFYTDKEKNIMRVTRKEEKFGKFVFAGLPLNQNSLAELEDPGDFTIAGSVLFGDKNTPLVDAKMVVKDEKGHTIDESTTNALGSFVFRKLPPGSNYIIEMESGDVDLPEDTKITITNKAGKEIKTMRTNSKGKFQFSVLADEKNFIEEMSAEDKDLLMDVSGIAMSPDKQILEGTRVFLLDDKGNKIAETVTGKDGVFAFKNLASAKNYMISLDIEDPSISGMDKIYIADKNGKIVKELKRKNNFNFHLLATDKKELSEIFVDDPWLDVFELKNQHEKKTDSLTIVESIYYAKESWKFDAAGKGVLDKVVNVMKSDPKLIIELSSHSDAKGEDAFNLQLSERRARTAVEYIISRGIKRTRISAKGYGETKLINNCGNGAECSDEQHAVNRRTEFKITRGNN